MPPYHMNTTSENASHEGVDTIHSSLYDHFHVQSQSLSRTFVLRQAASSFTACGLPRASLESVKRGERGCSARHPAQGLTPPLRRDSATPL